MKPSLDEDIKRNLIKADIFIFNKSTQNIQRTIPLGRFLASPLHWYVFLSKQQFLKLSNNVSVAYFYLYDTPFS